MDFTVDVKRTIGVIKEKNNGWRRELNMVSWNGAEAKYDIRDWGETRDKMSKGITLTADEALALYGLLKEEFGKEKTDA